MAKQEVYTLLELYNNATPDGRETIETIIFCATNCGQAFFDEMGNLLERGDQSSILNALTKWAARAKEGAIK